MRQVGRQWARWGALLLAVAGAASAWAQPYKRTAVPGKEYCLSWNKRDISYRVHSAGSSKTPGDLEFAAIDASFATWQALAASCSDFRFIRGEQIDKVIVGKAEGSQDNNVVAFREKNCRDVVPNGDPCIGDNNCGNVYDCWDHSDFTIGLTTTTFSFKTGTIFDGDIELNASPHGDGDTFLFTTIGSPPCEPGALSTDCVATDIQNTMTHEIGHLIGLDHVDVLGATMEASAPLGETRKRIIDSGTGLGFCDTYPRGLPPQSCEGQGQLRQKIIAKGSGTPGLQFMGCGAAGSASLFPLSALWLLGLWARRRR